MTETDEEFVRRRKPGAFVRDEGGRDVWIFFPVGDGRFSHGLGVGDDAAGAWAAAACNLRMQDEVLGPDWDLRPDVPGRSEDGGMDGQP